MKRPRLIVALAGLWFCVGSLFGADQDLKGKIVKVDPDTRKVTIQTDSGKHEYLVDANTKILVGKAVSKDGAKDKRFVPGAEVSFTTTPSGKTLREVHLAEKAVEPKEKREPKAEAKEELGDKDDKSFKAVKGTLVKVLSVDVEKLTIQVQTESGKKIELKLDKETKFIGPRGGVSDKGIKDDRLAPGHEIKFVTDAGGKNVTEVHLAYRKRDDKGDK
jgi:hypothetical protein